MAQSKKEVHGLVCEIPVTIDNFVDFWCELSLKESRGLKPTFEEMFNYLQSKGFRFHIFTKGIE